MKLWYAVWKQELTAKKKLKGKPKSDSQAHKIGSKMRATNFDTKEKENSGNWVFSHVEYEHNGIVHSFYEY